MANVPLTLLLADVTVLSAPATPTGGGGGNVVLQIDWWDVPRVAAASDAGNDLADPQAAERREAHAGRRASGPHRLPRHEGRLKPVDQAIKTLVALDANVSYEMIQAALPVDTSVQVVGMVEGLDEAWNTLQETTADLLVVACGGYSDRALYLIEGAVAKKPAGLWSY